MPDDQLYCLFCTAAAIEFDSYFAAGFDGTDAPVELIWRSNSVPIELCYNIAGLQSEKLSRAVVVHLVDFYSPFLRAWNTAATV